MTEEPAGPPPPNHLVWGILTTVFCCLPFGILSILQAAKVNRLWLEGRTDDAREAARSAKKWAIVAVVTGFVLLVLVAVLFGTVVYDLFRDTPEHAS